MTLRRCLPFVVFLIAGCAGPNPAEVAQKVDDAATSAASASKSAAGAAAQAQKAAEKAALAAEKAAQAAEAAAKAVEAAMKAAAEGHAAMAARIAAEAVEKADEAKAAAEEAGAKAAEADEKAAEEKSSEEPASAPVVPTPEAKPETSEAAAVPVAEAAAPVEATPVEAAAAEAAPTAAVEAAPAANAAPEAEDAVADTEVDAAADAPEAGDASEAGDAATSQEAAAPEPSAQPGDEASEGSADADEAGDEDVGKAIAALAAATEAAAAAEKAAADADAAAKEAAAVAAKAAEGTAAEEPPASPAPADDAVAMAEPVVDAPKTLVDPTLAALFQPLPEAFRDDAHPITAEKVELGRMLYFDTRLSGDDSVSCNSCHGLDTFGVDGKPTSEGIGGQRGERNAPSVFNAAGHIAQFWDGRAKDVEEQALGPVLNSVEMGMDSEEAVVAKLKTVPEYVAMFASAFEDGLTWTNVGEAIGAFERGLVTPGRWDSYLRGYKTLTDAEVQGAKTFVNTGCAACHNGALMGGGMFQKVGLVLPYETEDTGRFQVTGNDADRHVFKVPSLRNVAETGPYFHDGSIASLPEAVQTMAKHQLGRELGQKELGEITAFLNALTGQPDGPYTTMPTLPGTGAM